MFLAAHERSVLVYGVTDPFCVYFGFLPCLSLLPI